MPVDGSWARQPRSTPPGHSGQRFSHRPAFMWRLAWPAVRTGGINALAHITGGGLLENIPRVLPEGLGVEIDGSHWTAPPVFGWLQEQGGVESREMARTFNCGIGMVAIAAADQAAAIIDNLNQSGEQARAIGEVVTDADAGVRIENLQAAPRNSVMARLKLGVLISGRGSNLQALIEACADADFPAEIVLVLSNKPDAKGLAHAANAGLANSLYRTHRLSRSRKLRPGCP